MVARPPGDEQLDRRSRCRESVVPPPHPPGEPMPAPPPPANVLAFEDSQNGVRAARDASLHVVVTVNDYTCDQHFTGALVVLEQLDSVDLRRLESLHAGALQ